MGVAAEENMRIETTKVIFDKILKRKMLNRTPIRSINSAKFEGWRRIHTSFERMNIHALYRRIVNEWLDGACHKNEIIMSSLFFISYLNFFDL